jgi:hypothetical protein
MIDRTPEVGWYAEELYAALRGCTGSTVDPAVIGWAERSAA